MFTDIALRHIQNPRNVGPLAGASHYGEAGMVGEGPFVQLWFLVEGGCIAKATYRTYGCPTSIASSSLVAELLRGRTVEQALELSEEDLKRLIGQIPEGKEDCPGRAIDAMKNAFRDGVLN